MFGLFKKKKTEDIKAKLKERMLDSNGNYNEQKFLVLWKEQQIRLSGYNLTTHFTELLELRDEFKAKNNEAT
jgi:hypothetical protein